MKRLFINSSGDIGIGEEPEPRIDSYEVLIKVKACSICGGDIKIYKSVREKIREIDTPFPLKGHEWSGEIVEVGSKITDFRAGDRVARCFANYCGFCINCRLGMPNFCIGIEHEEHSGGFAEFVKFYIPPSGGRGLYKIPEGISYEEAALAEPGTCAIGAVLKANVNPGDFVAVIGLGGLGQLITQRLSAYGGYTIGIDINENKLARASKWCKYVINSSLEDPVEKVKEITQGVGADIVFEVVGIETTWIQAIEMLRMGGRLIMVGVFTEPTKRFVLDRIFRKNITIIPSKGPSPLITPQGEPLIWRDLRDGIIKPSLIYDVFPVERANEAFYKQAYGDVAKGVIKFD